MAVDGFQIRGVVGQINWAYYTAAAIHGYTVQRDKSTGLWNMRGTVVTSDAFRLSQRPLLFVATHTKWKWTIDTFKIVNGTVEATLSPFKE